ncbi:MAG: hypothetical protein FRX49_10663 [Trebouxia sp. A1-2]|nr:MAG: hypothetical protein FRX49_10663 [Trebouxia sp. A1-2]
MDEEQQPFTPQDGPSSGKHSQPTTQLCETSQAEKPSDMAEEQAEGAPEWLGGILHDLLNTEVKTALETVLLPRTRAIEQDVSTMQSQAQSISVKSKEEHAEVPRVQSDIQQQLAQLLFLEVSAAVTWQQHKGINVIPVGGKPLRAGWGKIGIAPNRRSQLILQHAQQLVHRLNPSLRLLGFEELLNVSLCEQAIKVVLVLLPADV